jgi:hypothetical protein
MYSVMYMPAVRTQIYLTPELRARVDEYRGRTHQSLAEVIRCALNAYLDGARVDRDASLRDTFGALPDLTVPPRDEWERA